MPVAKTPLHTERPNPKWKVRPKKPKRRKQPKARRYVLTSYHAYIRSDRWRKKRRSFIGQRNHRCEECRGTGKLTVHHKHYRSLGNEKAKDVVVLCWPCHQREHPDKLFVEEAEEHVRSIARYG